MKTLILYDSIFHNTEKIAFGIRDGIGGDVRALNIGDWDGPIPADVDLFVVGSPTRGFRPTPAISEFINRLPSKSLLGKRVAAFDTRMVISEVKNWFLTFMVGIFGFAAEKIGAGLKAKGGTLIPSPEGFFVGGAEGPLKEGELDRAVTWGKRLRT